MNIRFDARPAMIDPAHQLTLVRVARLFRPGISEEELYEATRRWWRIGAARRAPGTARAPQYALAVYQGVVRATYRIECWERAGADVIATDERFTGRWGSIGEHDQELHDRYHHTDVTAHLPPGAQSPIRYVAC